MLVMATTDSFSFMVLSIASIIILVMLHYFSPMQDENEYFNFLSWYTNQRVTSYKLRVNILMSYVYCTSYGSWVIFIARVTSYFLHTSYELLFIARVTSYFLHTSYELLLLHKLRVIVYCTSYELLFIARVNELFFIGKLRVVINCASYELLFNCELQ